VTPRSSPIWRSIADSLQSEIGQGLYRPGDKLPTEAELALRFGVNRHTVRHALAALAEAELVHSRRGAGVFVASRPTEYPLGRRVRFHQNIRDSGRTPSLVSRAVAWNLMAIFRALPRKAANQLGPARSIEWVRLLRTEAVNVDTAGKPIEFGTTWFAGDRVVLTVNGAAMASPERHE